MMLISLIISTYYAVHIGDVDWEVMSNGEIKQKGSNECRQVLGMRDDTHMRPNLPYPGFDTLSWPRND